MSDGAARLIGLDWGTSMLRAYLFAGDGRVIGAEAQPWGIRSTPDGDFAAAFEATVRDWRSRGPNLPVIAAGMIGSSEGWVAAPYCPCPAGAGKLSAALVARATPRDGTLHVVPGVELTGEAPDFMRGEETQVIGALALHPDLCEDAVLVLPGTHAKWIEVDAGNITRFTTYLTGELFAVLSEYSILGRPARGARSAPATGTISWAAFARGVDLAREKGERGLAPLLFVCRSLVLSAALRADESLDFLSGLLIGDELRAALAAARITRPPVLIGTAALCVRYEQAFKRFGFPDVKIIDDSAPAGLWAIALRAGLVIPAVRR